VIDDVYDARMPGWFVSSAGLVHSRHAPVAESVRVRIVCMSTPQPGARRKSRAASVCQQHHHAPHRAQAIADRTIAQAAAARANCAVRRDRARVRAARDRVREVGEQRRRRPRGGTLRVYGTSSRIPGAAAQILRIWAPARGVGLRVRRGRFVGSRAVARLSCFPLAARMGATLHVSCKVVCRTSTAGRKPCRVVARLVDGRYDTEQFIHTSMAQFQKHERGRRSARCRGVAWHGVAWRGMPSRTYVRLFDRHVRHGVLHYRRTDAMRPRPRWAGTRATRPSY
jgi:hypothetical protein